MGTVGPESGDRPRASVVRMNVAEARQVTWLRSRPKPLGELLDEGYLNTTRLEWAAKWAYNPRLREAARVLLEWQARRAEQAGGAAMAPASAARMPIPVGISLEEARSTPWPFGPLKGEPMGVLSETRRVSLKDLAYLVENAWDDRIRRAAVALLLERLGQEIEQPPPPAGFVHVVAGKRSYAQRRQLWLAFVEGSIYGAFLAAAVLCAVGLLLRQQGASAPRLTLEQIWASPPLIALTVVTVLVVAGGALLLPTALERLIIRRLDEQIENYRRGDEGEERVVEKARRALDGQWTLFRNVMLPGRRGDLDVVLVGPSGIWAIEVKALRGQYRNRGETWEQQSGSRWRRIRRNPSSQARRRAAALAEFLKADGIKTYVHVAIAWANEESQILVEDPTVPIWTLDRLEDELGNLWDGQRLGAREQQRIVEKLTRLCQAPSKGPW